MCCSVGIIIMKHALFLCSFTPFVPFSLSLPFFPLFLFVPASIHFQLPLYYFSFSLTSLSRQLPIYPPSWPIYFSPSPLACSPPCRGASVIGALSVLGQRTAGPGQGTLRAGFRPGRCPPICSPLRPSPCAHSAPASPGRAGPGDAKVHKLTTPLFSTSVSWRNTFWQ